MRVRGQNLPPLEFDQLKSLEHLDRCLKETLRLRPPIMTMMRMVKTPQVSKFCGMQIFSGKIFCEAQNLQVNIC